MNNKIYVDSEIGNLRRVIVHKPDEGISRISPKRSDELLFDDIVDIKRMQDEHKDFIKVLNFFLGEENVLETEDLLKEALDTAKDGKRSFIEMIVDFEEVPQSYMHMLLNLDSVTLAKVLISGYHSEEDLYMFDPIPNFIFTRDIAVTIKDHIIITKAAKLARQRENILTRFIIHYHPIFVKCKEEGKVINLNKVDQFPPSRLGEKVSIEGGDLMILKEGYLLIGGSERTTNHAFDSIKKTLFARNIIKKVVKIEIPDERSFMHIDTLFTRISEDEIVAFKPIVVDGLSSWVEVHDIDGNVSEYQSIKEFFLTEINPHMKFLLAGNGVSPYQEREQWTDACNLVAVKPGVAISYDRNTITAQVFEEHGYHVIHVTEFLQSIKDNKSRPEDIEKTIIALNSTELSRARGGSHCMTCPIERK